LGIVDLVAACKQIGPQSVRLGRPAREGGNVAFVVLIARILYGLIFVGSGIAGHLQHADATAAYGEMRGVPNAKMWTQLSGVLIAAGGIAVILGVWVDLAALGLVAYSLIAAFWVHHFWTDEDQMTRTIEMTMFMKNLSIAGGGLALFAVWGFLGEQIGLAITGPVFELSL
jgi:uncharacterized membrane protein YphA (DoxX/SURF4 family)